MAKMKLFLCIYILMDRTLQNVNGESDCCVADCTAEMDPYSVIWTIGGGEHIYTFGTSYCNVFMDQLSFKEQFDTVIDNPFVIQGYAERYTCQAHVPSNCSDITLFVGSNANCARVISRYSLTTPDFEEACHPSTGCATVIQLEIENSAGTSFHTFNTTGSNVNFTVENFRSLSLSYQTCKNESLRFQIPVSVSVPLNVTCSLSNEDLLATECLLPRPTVAATTESNNRSTPSVLNSQSDNNGARMRLDLVAIIAIGIGCGLFLIVAIIGLVYMFQLRKKKQSPNSKYGSEMPIVNQSMVSIVDNEQRASHGVENHYAQIGPPKGDTQNLKTTGQTSQSGQPTQATAMAGMTGYAELPLANANDGSGSGENGLGNYQENNEVKDQNAEKPKLGPQELEALYARPSKIVKQPKMVENVVYESAGESATTAFSKQTPAINANQNEATVVTNIKEGSAPGLLREAAGTHDNRERVGSDQSSKLDNQLMNMTQNGEYCSIAETPQANVEKTEKP